MTTFFLKKQNSKSNKIVEKAHHSRKKTPWQLQQKYREKTTLVHNWFQIKTTNFTWQGTFQIHPNAMTLILGSQPNLGQNKEEKW